MDMSRREFLQAGIGTAMGLGSTLQGSPQRKDLAFLTISELSELIRTRKVSPVEITQTILERIEKLRPIFTPGSSSTGRAGVSARCFGSWMPS